MRIQVDGMDNLKRVLDSIPGAVRKAAHSELVDITLDLQGRAQRLAPVDTGDLRGSGFSEVEDLDGTVGFTAPYALRQHEMVEARHPKGGQAKYLEEPFKQNEDKYVKSMQERVRRAVEK